MRQDGAQSFRGLIVIGRDRLEYHLAEIILASIKIAARQVSQESAVGHEVLQQLRALNIDQGNTDRKRRRDRKAAERAGVDAGVFDNRCLKLGKDKEVDVAAAAEVVVPSSRLSTDGL